MGVRVRHSLALLNQHRLFAFWFWVSKQMAGRVLAPISSSVPNPNSNPLPCDPTPSPQPTTLNILSNQSDYVVRVK